MYFVVSLKCYHSSDIHPLTSSPRKYALDMSTLGNSISPRVECVCPQFLRSPWQIPSKELYPSIQHLKRTRLQMMKGMRQDPISRVYIGCIG